MPVQINIGNGELFDRLTILEIKQEHGLKVDQELHELDLVANKIISEFPCVVHLARVLKTVNAQCWIIEDGKREHERNANFDQNFVNLSRLVYMLNDQRATVKRQIDRLTGSEYTEVKSHLSVK